MDSDFHFRHKVGNSVFTYPSQKRYATLPKKERNGESVAPILW